MEIERAAGGPAVTMPAVIMIVEGRVPRGGRKRLDEFSVAADAYFAQHGSAAVRLHWHDHDPLRFRALLEYESESAFEAYDVRTRRDAGFLELRDWFLSHLEGTPVVSVWRQGEAQHGADLVRAYWTLAETREWAGLRAILADDVVFEWPAFNERVTGAAAVVSACRHAPNDWIAKVGALVACGERAASHVTIVLAEGPQIVLSTFWEVRSHRIVRATEFWSTVGRDPRPGWRAAWSMPLRDVTRG